MKLLKHINHNYGGYAREAYTDLLSAYKGSVDHEQKFVLFGRGCTGSTLLTDLLNSTDQVKCDKEIFNRPIWQVESFLKNRAKLFSEPIYGFKLLSYQLRNLIKPSDANEFLRYLSEDLGYKIIFLRRKDLLRQTLSKHYAMHRKS